ncbi:MAG: DUF4330 domain-containing protein [Clostridia bacterium]|nr:DUF4330 domain-containing protein [Clostridia bacterium]
MNKDRKIKGKFNIIDLLVILLIIAVIAGLFVRFGSSVTTAVKSDEEFECIVKVQSVRQFTVDALTESMETKSRLTDKKATVDLGEITGVECEPAEVLSEKTNGTMVYAPQEDRYNVYVTIRTHAKESDNSYILADSNELAVGRSIEIFSKYVHTSGLITKVEKIDR